jgi:hypothetical protein
VRAVMPPGMSPAASPNAQRADGPVSGAILTGAVGDYGPVQSIYPDGKADSDHNREMELKLTHGSFRLDIAGLHKQIVSAYKHWLARDLLASRPLPR